MARLASQATAGYFPTPPHLVPTIASLALVERERYDHPVFFDPCAGTGATLVDLAANALGVTPEEAAPFCRGIELEGTRATELRKRLAKGNAYRGDAFLFGIEAEPGAAVLYLNPPYDTDRDYGRLEQRFLARFTEALAPGGALLYVVPVGTLAASAEHLASWYSRVRAYRFPDADFAAFRQVVVVALRREEAGPVDRFTVRRLVAAAGGETELPVMGTGDGPDVVVRVPHARLSLHEWSVDVEGLLAAVRPFAADAGLMGFDRDARELLGKPLPVALPPRPAHIALALAAGLLNGRRLQPNEPGQFPPLLAKGTFSRTLLTVDQRRDKEGRVTGEVCVQQPRLDIHVLRLDTRRFHQLALGTEPSGATSIERFNTADLMTHYSRSLARLVREQLPALHDPEAPADRIALPELARKPYRRQAALIQAGLKLLARGENPQLLAEVGTGKSTVALSIAGALRPEHVRATRAALAGAGYDPRRLRTVRRVLIVCPPHLLGSWTDQAAAVLPSARVQVVRAPSDLERRADIYVLSREVAKLGSRVAGVRGRRCPDCGHPLPAKAAKLASGRMRCGVRVAVPSGWKAEAARDLALVAYRYVGEEVLERLLPVVEAHPAVHRRASERWDAGREPATIPVGGNAVIGTVYERLLGRIERHFLEAESYKLGFWLPVEVAGRLAILLRRWEAFTDRCRDLAERRRVEGRQFHGYGRTIGEELDAYLSELAGDEEAPSEGSAGARQDVLERALVLLLDEAKWETRPGCGTPLHYSTAEPRRYPLARYVLRRRRGYFDLVILDEAHEFSTTGSAQQNAAHRLAQLPRVPTIALTGSLMGGYASSLFSNAWALSGRFRAQFGRDEKAAFVARYGYRKILVSHGEGKPLEDRSYGRQSDRTDGDGLVVRALGEAPGVLPLYILEHVLPTGLVMHKEDLDDELPPCREEPIAVRPDEGDALDEKLLKELDRLRRALVARIREDRGTDRAGLLWGAMAELPSYVDLANEECGPFVLKYPDDAGGEEVAVGASFPASWRSPKESWLLDTVREELEADRRVLVFLRHTGNRGFVGRLGRLLEKDLGEAPTFLDAARVPTATRERWLDRVIDDGCRVLLVHPKAVQTGLNNLTAFHTAIWYEGPDYDARVTRQANGRPHRIGQTEPVRLLYPYYADTLQKTALDLVARKITASLQVDGLSLAGALEAAGALSEEDRLHASAALAIGQALYRVAASGR